MMTVFAILFFLVVLIFVHELGHFLAARSVGVRVRKFSLFFPPRLISFTSLASGWVLHVFFFRRNGQGKLVWGPVFEKVISGPLSKASETEYSLGLVPLGGYVKMAGTIDESLDDTITGAPDELFSKNRLQQAWVMSAGVIMNTLLAVLLFSGITFFGGIPVPTDEPVVMEIKPGYPATEAGIQGGDRILSIDGEPVDTWTHMNTTIQGRPLETLLIRWERDGEVMSAEITTRADEVLQEGERRTVGKIGIYPEYQIRDAKVGESLKAGWVTTGFWFGLIVKSLKMIATGEASIRDLGGPILIADLARRSAQAGIGAFLGLMAVVSVNLAFINILPIPVLDGGHLLIILIEAIVRRPMGTKVRMAIQQIGMALLLLIVILVFYNDFVRFIWPK